jgi:transcriptional regulator
LQGHLARANPQTNDIESCAVGTHTAKTREGLVIFQGAHAYVSPSFYPSKEEHHRVVPTWNYEMVQVRGAVTVRDDRDWLRNFLPNLTALHESERAIPWKMGDAPDEFIEGLLHNLVGVEIAIEHIAAKRKLSQNRSEADRWGTMAGLRDDGADEVVQAMESLEK